MVSTKSPRKPVRHAPTKYKGAGNRLPHPGRRPQPGDRRKPFREKKLLYYIIDLEVSDMTMPSVPVGKADELGIRAIVGKKESQKALRLIAEEFEPIPADWKLRYQMNLDLLKKGSILDIANVVRALYRRSRSRSCRSSSASCTTAR